jgi:hypothetical protein
MKRNSLSQNYYAKARGDSVLRASIPQLLHILFGMAWGGLFLLGFIDLGIVNLQFGIGAGWFC